MKQSIFILILLLPACFLNAKKYDFEEVNIVGIENPGFITISPDGLRMIIIDFRKKEVPQVKQTVRTSTKAPWGAATAVPAINDLLGPETQIKGITFSFDGNHLYFSANLPDTRGGYDIYSLEISSEGYTSLQNLGPAINTTENEYYPSVSGNERIMTFTREIEMKKVEDQHPGHLWQCKLDDTTTKWAAPEKLNVIINDGGIGYPRLYDDNKTIFYSRIDEEEKKWKIFWTKRIGDIHWYLPVKLDTLSTDDHEISPYYCKQDGFLYYIKLSGSESSPRGVMYRFRTEREMIPEKCIEIKGIVTDSVHKSPLGAFVLVTDPILGRTEFITNSGGKNGGWKTLLLAGKQYLLHIWKDRYSHYYRLFTPGETISDRNLPVELTPQVDVTLNIYDREELWPLMADIIITDEKGIAAGITPWFKEQGIQKMILPIGKHYLFNVSRKDYVTNSLDLNLSEIVLFDHFTRDIELEPVKRKLDIFVTEKDTLLPLDASIEITDVRNSQFFPVPTGTKGFYSILLREGEQYELDVRGPKYYAFRHLAIDLDSDRVMKSMTVELTPLTRKVPIRLNNINFELNSADLMQSSYPELNRVVRLLKDNPDIYVELSAHTCDIGSDHFNDLLSLKRARSVVNYLTTNGIKYSRMIARGYGEKIPLVPNTSEGNRMQNRRVELKILDENDQEFQVEERINE